ncbi:hypothetical protein H5410_015078 [Solanum commersonii]|uniref:Uncharacterized protein n=1 Tax=Solanum commersonii TaxID=4109 RepID=A0A9J5ZSQ1_SOLCO|nr:hypothetical protein H5410_015078 [Solanum commersonii]
MLPHVLRNRTSIKIRLNSRHFLNKPKNLEVILKVARCTPEEKKLGCTPLEPEVFEKTHVKKKLNESDFDVWLLDCHVKQRHLTSYYVGLSSKTYTSIDRV